MAVVTGQYGAQCLYRNYNESYLGGVGNGKIVHRGGKLLLRSKMRWSMPVTDCLPPSQVLTQNRQDGNDYWMLVPYSEVTEHTDPTVTTIRDDVQYNNSLGDGLVFLGFDSAQKYTDNIHRTSEGGGALETAPPLVPEYRDGVEYRKHHIALQGKAVLYYPFWGDAPANYLWKICRIDSDTDYEYITASVEPEDEGRWIVGLYLQFGHNISLEGSVAAYVPNDLTTTRASFGVYAIFTSQRQHRIGNGLTFTFSRAYPTSSTRVYNNYPEYRTSIDNYLSNLSFTLTSRG